MVSVHGTGTPLGDPIEIGALGQSMAASAQQPASLALGAFSPACSLRSCRAGSGELSSSKLVNTWQRGPCRAAAALHCLPALRKGPWQAVFRASFTAS